MKYIFIFQSIQDNETFRFKASSFHFQEFNKNIVKVYVCMGERGLIFFINSPIYSID